MWVWIYYYFDEYAILPEKAGPFKTKKEAEADRSTMQRYGIICEEPTLIFDLPYDTNAAFSLIFIESTKNKRRSNEKEN